MGAPGTRSPGVASPPSRPPGSTAAWRQRQASPGLHRTLPSRRGGVAANPSPFAGGGAMLARTSARSPAGATPSYSPPGSAMVSRQGQTSPGLLHPPPSREGEGANSAGAPWRATGARLQRLPAPGGSRCCRCDEKARTERRAAARPRRAFSWARRCCPRAAPLSHRHRRGSQATRQARAPRHRARQQPELALGWEPPGKDTVRHSSATVAVPLVVGVTKRSGRACSAA